MTRLSAFLSLALVAFVGVATVRAQQRDIVFRLPEGGQAI